MGGNSVLSSATWHLQFNSTAEKQCLRSAKGFYSENNLFLVSDKCFSIKQESALVLHIY